MSNSKNDTHLKRKGKILASKVHELSKEINSFIELSESIADKLKIDNTNQSVETYGGLNFISLRNALCDLSKESENSWIPSVLATSGSGPWYEKEFDDFLLNKGIDLYQMPSEDVNGLILGVEGWSEDDLTSQIFSHSTENLKIYSQEIFVFGLIAGQDPYLILEETVTDEIGINHPGIQFILNQNFVWPNWGDSTHGADTNDDSEWDFDVSDWSNESVLMQLGYSASASGPSDFERRRILSSAFELRTLPGIESSEQKNKWGISNSPRRLRAISHFIGWLINLQGSEKPKAREKWTSDLVWLKNQYYSKAMHFPWPTINSNTSAGMKAMPSPTRQINEKTPSAKNFQGGFVPKHALGEMIGHKRRISLSDAYDALLNYTDGNGLSKSGSPYINSDHKMFALTGRWKLLKNELYSIVEKNLV